MAGADQKRRRRLTDRQTAVLAAVERLGRASMLELHAEFPGLAPSTIKRVLDALASKGLVASAGDPHLIYLGGVEWWSTADSGIEDRRFATIVEAVQAADLGLEVSADAQARKITIYLPLAELETYLAGRPSAACERIRGLVWILERDREPVRLRIGTEISPGPAACVAVELTVSAPG